MTSDLFSPSKYSKKREATEFHEVVRTADWLRGEIHQGKNVYYTTRPFPDLEFTHFPGEGSSGKEGFFAKRMGVRAGVHDFLFWWPMAQTGFIEMKAPDKKQKSGQRDFDGKLAAMGFACRAVCYSTEEVRDCLKEWGLAYKHVEIPAKRLTHAQLLAIQAEIYRPFRNEDTQ